MVVDLLAGKQRFATLMDDIQPMILSQFIIWLDEKVAEFKVQGCMNLELSLEAPKWIKDYSMSMLVSGASLLGQKDILENDSERSASQSPRTPLSDDMPPRVPPIYHPSKTRPHKTQEGNVLRGAARRKRSNFVTPSSDLSFIEIKKERLDDDIAQCDYIGEDQNASPPDTVVPYVVNSNLSTSTPRPFTLQSHSLNTLASRLSGVLAGNASKKSAQATGSKSVMAMPPLSKAPTSTSGQLTSKYSSATISSSSLSVANSGDILSIAGPSGEDSYNNRLYSDDQELSVDQNALEMTGDNVEDTESFIIGQDGDSVSYSEFDDGETSGAMADGSFLSESVDSKALVAVSQIGMSSDDMSLLAKDRQSDDDEAGTCSGRELIPSYMHTLPSRSSTTSNTLQYAPTATAEFGDPTAFYCMYCQLKFLFVSDYRQHIRSHVDKNASSFTCILCGSVNKHLSAFVRHCVAHTPRTRLMYRCVQCGKGYPRQDVYAMHIERCTSAKSVVWNR